MSASRLRRTARSSCRMRTCSSRKRWISVCCSGLISSELPSLRAACSSPKRCSVCVSSASSRSSVARNSRSACRRSSSTVVNGRVIRRAAAQADQRGAAREIVERVDDEVAVVGERRDAAAAPGSSAPAPRAGRSGCRRRRRARDWRSRSKRDARSSSAASTGVCALRARGRAVGECGLERPFETRGEHELLAARRETVARARVGSGRNWKRSAGIASDSTLDVSSGVSFAVAPSASSK